jgi:hypothetical protein
MIITKEGKPVGTLHTDGTIKTQIVALQQLNASWREHGIPTMCTTAESEAEITDEVLVEGMVILPLCAENIPNVIGELEMRGYEVSADLKPEPAVEYNGQISG